MIRKLKRKFLALTMLLLLLLLAAIITAMNLLNYRSVIREADDMLGMLSENKGAFPELRPGRPGMLPPDASPELRYETRYFTVLLDQNDHLVLADTSHIAAVDTARAVEFAGKAIETGARADFLGDYRFLVQKEGGLRRLTFLDCGRKLQAYQDFLLTSILMGAAGYVIVCVILIFLGGRIVRPMAESYEKQRRFITDAGHEIKTPLTIIRANADLLEMEMGENECLEDIRQQSRHLAELTNDLVSLARMEEAEMDLPHIEFSLSDVIAEAVADFRAPAQMRQLQVEICITPLLSMTGDEKAIGRLAAIVMDNALKYTPTGGHVSVQLTKTGRTVAFSVCNDTAQPLSSEELSRVFDRFYRVDPSRNTETGGFGIGLSLARAIVAAHGGKLQADAPEDCTFRITALFGQ